jgi:hypothetical protein
VTSFSRAAIALAFTLFACAPASAQFRPNRPYRGIFASGVDGIGQTITASGTLSGGWDDNVYAGAHLGQDNVLRTRQSGALTQVAGGLNYAMTLERASIMAGAGAVLRYFPSVTNDVFEAYNARLGGSVTLSKKPTVTAHAMAAYQPYTFFSALPEPDAPIEPAVPPEPDFIPVETQYVSYKAGLGLSHRLSRRFTFDSRYDWYTANRLGRDFWRQGADANIGYQLTRDVRLRLGYRISEGHYDDRIVRTNRPLIALDFNHALSLTRNTTIGFSAGTESTVIEGEFRTRYRAVGDFSITHEMGRSWTLNGRYHRGTYYVETLPEPVFGDSARASLVGLLTRSLQFEAAATASLGSASLSSSRHYNMYSGLVGLSAALNRHMNVGVDFTYYTYRFDEDFALDAGVPRNLDRRSLRGHLTLWAPILNRTRRPNAAR